MIKSISYLLICLGLALAIPFYFNDILTILVENTFFGWVMTTILIRLIVIVLFIVALKSFFSAFQKTKKLKTWIIVLIGLIPGFFISFAIAPIYNTDYGLFNDGVKLENLERIEVATGGTFVNESRPTLIAFVTTTCPFCKLACRKLGQNLQKGQTVKVDFIFPGTKEDADRFLEENNGTEFNGHLIQDDATFMGYAGYSFPSIFIVNAQGETDYHWIGDQMNYSALDYLLSLEQ